jgi:hypothetical protein
MERREKTAAFGARTRLGKAPGSAAGRYLSGIRKPGEEEENGMGVLVFNVRVSVRTCRLPRVRGGGRWRWWGLAWFPRGGWAERSGDVTRQCAGLDASVLDQAFSTAISIFPLRFQRARQRWKRRCGLEENGRGRRFRRLVYIVRSGTDAPDSMCKSVVFGAVTAETDGGVVLHTEAGTPAAEQRMDCIAQVMVQIFFLPDFSLLQEDSKITEVCQSSKITKIEGVMACGPFDDEL